MPKIKQALLPGVILVLVASVSFGSSSKRETTLTNWMEDNNFVQANSHIWKKTTATKRGTITRRVHFWSHDSVRGTMITELITDNTKTITTGTVRWEWDNSPLFARKEPGSRRIPGYVLWHQADNGFYTYTLNDEDWQLSQIGFRNLRWRDPTCLVSINRSPDGWVLFNGDFQTWGQSYSLEFSAELLNLTNFAQSDAVWRMANLVVSSGIWDYNGHQTSSIVGPLQDGILMSFDNYLELKKFDWHVCSRWNFFTGKDSTLSVVVTLKSSPY